MSDSKTPMPKDAIKMMERVMLGWFTDDPVMLGAWTLINKVADPSQNTIGIDSRFTPVTIRYNPKFVEALNFEQLEHVMASEGFKVLLRHPTTRHKDPKHISGLASTVTINEIGDKAIREILGDKDLPTAKKFGLEEDQYFEEYFRELLEKQEEVEQKLQEMFGDSQPGEGEGEGQGGQGEGEGEGQPQDGNGKGFKEFKDSKDALKDYMNPSGTSNKDWGKNDMFDAEVSNMINEKKGSSKEWGKHTGGALESIVAANTPKLDYKSIIRRFNNSVISSKAHASRMKVNRRYDLAQPGHRREYKSKILFAVDVSGSMSEKELSEAFAIINNVCRHSELTYMLFDTEIKLTEKKFKKAKKEFNVVGRGGTDFQAVCNYAQENKIDGCIIFTDGCASPPVQPTGTKVLWMMTAPDMSPPVPWGMVCHLRD